MKEDIINLQNHGAKIVILPNNDPQFPYYNPSIAYDGNGKLRIAIRSCNFTINDEGKWYLADGGSHAKTKIMYGYLDPETLDISDLKELKYGEDVHPHIRDITGLEDARIFWRKDGMHFNGVQTDVSDRDREPAYQAELVLDEKTNTLHFVRTLEKPDKTRVEKNWAPTNVPAGFQFSYSPIQVWIDGKIYGDNYKGILHGGSQLLKQNDDTFIAVLHSKHLHATVGRVYNKYHYVNYFAEYSADGLLKRISKSFMLGLDNIEFCGGMVEYGKYLLMSFGIKDSRMAIVRIRKQDFMNMLEPYNPGADIAVPDMYERRRIMRQRRLQHIYNR